MKDMFLLNYRDNVNPFEHYVLKGSLWESEHVPCSITPLYPFIYCICFAFPDKKVISLIIISIIITIQRYFMYKMFKKKSRFIILILFPIALYINYDPISWIIIYIYPIIYWIKNNIKLGIIEILIDIFCLLIIPLIL